MVQEAMSYLDQTPNKETKMQLLDTLRTVTEGKVRFIILWFLARFMWR